MIAAEVETSAYGHMDTNLLGVNIEPLEKWCREILGPQAEFRDQVSDEYPWTVRYNNLGKFMWYFAREEYATMFKLRWL